MTAVACKYFVQNDKFYSFPEMFVLPRKYSSEAEVTVKDIYNSFPLKLSNYYLRFQTYLPDGATKIWADIPNMSSNVPFINGLVYVKVLRMPEQIMTKHPKEDSPTPMTKQFSGILFMDEPAKTEVKQKISNEDEMNKRMKNMVVPNMPIKAKRTVFEESVKDKVKM